MLSWGGKKMDIQGLTEALGLATQGLSTLKSFKDLLPTGKQEQFAQEVKGVEKAMKIAEAKAAEELGYKLCRCEFPPIIMKLEKNGAWVCPKCRNSDIQSIATGSLGDFEKQILLTIHKKAGVDSISRGSLAHILGISETKMEYYTKNPLQKYIRPHYSMMSPVEYSLSSEGQKHLVENDLID